MVTTQLYGLANMVSIAMGPRYGETYGHARKRGAVARLAARACELQAAAIGLPAALAIVAAPPLLGWLLPDYRPGLAPLVWLVPGVIALALALPGSQYLVAVGRQRRALVAIVAATALAAVGNHFALVGGYGLVGVAAATAGAYAAYFLLTAAISIWPELDRHDRLRYVTMLALLLVPVLCAAFVLERVWPAAAADWITTGLKTLAVAATWMASAAIAWRRGGWHAEFRKPRSPN
jgi:O-antigen/teichoic acid export membrane protein